LAEPEIQCGGCAFYIYIPFGGAFIEECGACANAGSPRDGEPVFEHEGCPGFEQNLLGWGGAMPRGAR